MNQRISLIASSLAFGTAVPYVYREMETPTVSHYTVESERLPEDFDGFKIVQLSDLHNKVFGKDNESLLRLIEEEKPDLIVMTGDMISHDNPAMEKYAELCRKMAGLAQLCYVNGNHEMSDLSYGDMRYIAGELEAVGAVCVDNCHTDLTRGNSRIRVCGICYPAEYYRGVREYKRGWKPFLLEDMVRYAGENDRSLYTILLAHNPLDFDVHAEWGADISFGGHVHGGFIRLPIVKGVFSPERKFFPKYKEGMYRVGDSVLIASRGLGRIRINNPPEVVSVTLKKKSNNVN